MSVPRSSGQGQPRQRVNMFDPVVFRIRVQGGLDESWLAYFAVQSMSVEVDAAQLCTTTLISEPVDQAALVGIINRLNGLGLPLMSVERVPAAADDGSSRPDERCTE